MALSDFDSPQTLPSGLPAGYNVGGFNPDGSLKWASLDRSPYVAPLPPTAGMVQSPAPISLKNLFAQSPTPMTGPVPLNTMIGTSRSAPIQAGINSATTQRNDNQKAAQQSLTDFTKEFIANRPKANQYAQEETNAISSIYGSGPGSMQSQLADINRQRQAAINMAAQSAMGRASRDNNFRRMTNGNSSYLDNLYGQQLRNVAVGAAGQYADQQGVDLRYLNEARQQAAGRRQAIIDNLAQRNFGPMEAAGRVEGMNQGLLGNLANLQYGNNVYERPEDQAMRQYNMLRSLGYQY